MKLFCKHNWVFLRKTKVPSDIPGIWHTKVVAGCTKCYKLKMFGTTKWALISGDYKSAKNQQKKDEQMNDKLSDFINSILDEINKGLQNLIQILCSYHRGTPKEIGDGYNAQIIFDDKGYRMYITKQDNDMIGSFRISYCPFCGKKLNVK